jgi:hypothetical protein
MAHFRATIQGARGMASRLGTKTSGITAKINGWNIGLVVEIKTDENGKDIILVWSTNGSNGEKREKKSKWIATIREGEENE